ncbi:nucleotidyltransferase [Candidatus Daviesbacteria bacterium]|nr:nucleotidyltransferase [Candidatus Daviesbacteria bacterium]
MELENTLKKVARILHKFTIPYLVTGGVAIVVWGRPRYTADIDIVIELKKKKVNKLVAALAKEGYIDEDAVNEALKSRGEFNFIDNSSSMKVDFWILDLSEFDKTRLKRAVVRNISGLPVKFSSPEDLILRKLLWFNQSKSTRQLEDIHSVMAIIKNQLDYGYLKKWARKQGTLDLLEEMIRLAV